MDTQRFCFDIFIYIHYVPHLACTVPLLDFVIFYKNMSLFIHSRRQALNFVSWLAVGDNIARTQYNPTLGRTSIHSNIFHFLPFHT